MPRNRSVSAVLGSTVQRAASPYASRSSTALRRRLVVVGLVLLALVLITVYFRESTPGALHRVQSGGATVLRPFEIGADRVAQPFRDVYGYFHGLATAKSENARLRAEVRSLRQRAAAGDAAARQIDHLEALLRYEDGPRFPSDYTPVNTRVIARPNDFDQQVVVAAGSNSHITQYAPVVTSDGLVGDVTMVGSNASRVTLLTDDSSAVGAYDVSSPTGATGVIRHGPSSDNGLILDRVTKDQVVHVGDIIATVGSRSRQFPSLYPRNIAIGRVTSVGQTDTDTFKQIQVEPYVDFGSIDSVAVLVTRKPQPQLP